MILWLVISFAMALFFGLQAGYGFRRVRRRRDLALVQDRLKLDESDLPDDESDGSSDDEASGVIASFLDDSGTKERIEDLLYQAGEGGDAVGIVARMVTFGVIPTGMLVMLTFNPALVVLMPAFAALPLFILLGKRRMRTRKIDEQLPVALEVMSISLRAGQSLAMTLENTAGEVQSPLREELQRCVEDHKLGRSVEESLIRMSRRLPRCRAMRTFVVAVLVLQQTGGNLIEVIGRIIETLRMQTQYERKLAAMTAEGKSSARMLGGLPVAFTFLAWIADPDYIGVLFTDPLGNKILFVATTLWLIGLTWTRKLASAAS